MQLVKDMNGMEITEFDHYASRLLFSTDVYYAVSHLLKQNMIYNYTRAHHLTSHPCNKRHHYEAVLKIYSNFHLIFFVLSCLQIFFIQHVTKINNVHHNRDSPRYGYLCDETYHKNAFPTLSNFAITLEGKRTTPYALLSGFFFFSPDFFSFSLGINNAARCCFFSFIYLLGLFCSSSDCSLRIASFQQSIIIIIFNNVIGKANQY